MLHFKEVGSNVLNDVFIRAAVATGSFRLANKLFIAFEWGFRPAHIDGMQA